MMFKNQILKLMSYFLVYMINNVFISIGFKSSDFNDKKWTNTL